VKGLQPNTSYLVRVRGFNAVGSSNSEPEVFRTMPAPPSCPQDLQQQGATPTSLRLAWLAPVADHGATVTSYQLECSRITSRGSQAAAWSMVYQGSDLHAKVCTQRPGYQCEFHCQT
jgi:hypothetical protein